jgi:hypothetical protein
MNSVIRLKQLIQDIFKCMCIKIKHIVCLFFTLFIFYCPLHSQDKKINKYVIELLPFDTNYDEFSPVYYGKGIVFCSNRKKELIINYSTPENKNLFDLYKVVPDNEEKWGKVKLFSGKLSTHFNIGPATFSSDGNTIYFNSNIHIDNRIGNIIDSTNSIGIFKAVLINGEWSEITPFRYNNDDYNFVHPSLSPDGKKLFFCSDKPGGFGGFDIYVCNFENGDWGAPVNLGETINTSGNELFPFIHGNGTLYFSSNNHNSMGGLDIFYSMEKDGKWEKPFHIDPPINSKFDDFGYITTKTLEDGYFSSNRNKNDNIYAFKTNFPTFETCDTLRLTNFCYIFDDSKGEGIDTTSLKYEWNLGDGSKIKGLQAAHCYKDTGLYIIQLNLIDTLTNEVMLNQASYELPIHYAVQPYIESTDTCKSNEASVFKASEKYLDNFKDCQYFWEFSDGKRQTGVLVTHTFKKTGLFTVKLGITSLDPKTGDLKKACVLKPITVLRN